MSVPNTDSAVITIKIVRFALTLIQMYDLKSRKCLFFTAPYVKVYLLENGAYVAKKKTKIARKTLDPLYQQTLQFEESPQGKVLQVSQCGSVLLQIHIWREPSESTGFEAYGGLVFFFLSSRIKPGYCKLLV